MSHRGVLLDRDNTIIADPGYIDDPDMVTLLPGAADSIRRLRDEGFAVAVVTNQSGVARGKFTEEQLADVHERMEELLHEQGVQLDGIYYCPYLDGPEAKVKKYRKQSNLRKPEPGMLLVAAEELDLSLAESWMVGDSSRDVVAGERAGCRTILLGKRNGECNPDYVADSLERAVDLVISNKDLPPKGQEVDSDEPKPVDMGQLMAEQAVREQDVVNLLTDIRDSLRRHERKQRHEDFSVLRLAGTLTQMLALIVGGWAMMAFFSDSSAALMRLILAGFLQLVALTAFVCSEKRS